MLAEGRRRQLHVLLTVVLDACTIAAAFSLAYLLRFFWEVVPASDSPPVGPYLAILPVLVPVWIGVFAAYGLYRERLQGFFDEALRGTSAVSVGMMALLAGSCFYPQVFPFRLWVFFSSGVNVVVGFWARRGLPGGPRG